MTGASSILFRDTRERRRLLASFGVSLLAHGAGFTIWILAAAALLSFNKALLSDLTRAREAALKRLEERIPTVFVEVDPARASETPPPETPNYSAHNSRAANPEPESDTGVPRIDGSQDKMVRTADVLRPAPQPQEAQPPTPPEPQPPKPQSRPKTQDGPGDLAVATPDPPAEAAPRSRPTSLLEARARQGGMLTGQKSRQQGGVKQRGAISLDAKASPFGAYDGLVIAAIQKRWYDLIDESSIAPRSGKVSIEFAMHYDGRVTDIKILEEDVGEILSLYCSKAISDPAPFPPWPSAMRQAIGKDHRVVRITFYYL